jgi:hypothetical protein
MTCKNNHKKVTIVQKSCNRAKKLQSCKKVAFAQKSYNRAKKFADFYVGIVLLSKKLQMLKKVRIAQKSCKCTK